MAETTRVTQAVISFVPQPADQWWFGIEYGTLNSHLDLNKAKPRPLRQFQLCRQ
jgi:hypothetical protein